MPSGDSSVYNKEYFEQFDQWYEDGSLAIKDSHRWNLIRSMAPEAKTLLDFGCNNGAFVDHMPLDLNLECSGYDPYTKYNDESVLEKPYDVLTMFHVMEHLDNPRETLINIDHKYFIFSIPWLGENMTAVSFVQFGYHIKPGEHKQFFTRKSLNILLREYKLLEEDYVDGYGENSEYPEHIVTQVRVKHEYWRSHVRSQQTSVKG